MGLGTWFDVVDDVMLQRWHTRHLPTDPAEVLGPDVKGKTFIVTGPTSGIGTTTAETLARAGARVVLACRTVKRGQALIDSWNSTESEPLRCEVMHLDLDSLDSVRTFASAFLAKGEPLHCLLNNAGVFDMSGAFNRTKDGHESHYGTNFLAPALLSLLLMPSLKLAGTASAPAVETEVLADPVVLGGAPARGPAPPAGPHSQPAVPPRDSRAAARGSLCTYGAAAGVQRGRLAHNGDVAPARCGEGRRERRQHVA